MERFIPFLKTLVGSRFIAIIRCSFRKRIVCIENSMVPFLCALLHSLKAMKLSPLAFWNAITLPAIFTYAKILSVMSFRSVF